uniref:Uncharacterized protein n=1 Tax=Haptolina ericina TaxID=156174 RepID=A0A7S3FIX3_9EUKA
MMGSSLSSLPVLRSIGSATGHGGGIFGTLVCGSPSLIFTPQLVRDLQAARPAPASVVRVLIIVGEVESLPQPQGGNGIPQAAEYTADLLRRCGHHVQMVVAPDEDHSSLKPVQVSRAFGWLERCWSDDAPLVPNTPAPRAEVDGEDSLPSDVDRFRAFWQSERGRLLVANVRAAAGQ